jgi:hypothetical protein
MLPREQEGVASRVGGVAYRDGFRVTSALAIECALGHGTGGHFNKIQMNGHNVISFQVSNELMLVFVSPVQCSFL